MLRALANRLHALIASGPRFLSRAYLSLLSGLCRAGLPDAVTARVANSVASAAWPPLQFRPRTVTLGSGTPVRLVPHLGEFDADALFKRRLAYESAVFQWLERHVPAYDLVIEIGANVGVFTVFLDAMARAPQARLRRVLAFEPSPMAYARLLANLAANDARAVSPFNAAICREAGFSTLFEPAGHLTNGSLDADFAALFSADVAATKVIAVAASDVGMFIEPGSAALIKIDVEGAEADVISALGPVLAARKPDLIVEVLPGAEDRIEAALCGLAYDRYLLTDAAPVPAGRLAANRTHRDWLLKARLAGDMFPCGKIST